MAALALAAPDARALDPFEIQVYSAEINAPGRFGLEVHLNYAIRADRAPSYPGEIPPDRVGRLTLEPSLGVTDWLELGAYSQFLAAPGGTYRFGGWKARAKLVVPKAALRRAGIPLFLGLNIEVGKVPRAVEQGGWANEFRPIIGLESGRWLVSVNPIFGYALSGPEKLKVALEPAAKVAWNTGHGYAVGAEYYAGLGLATDVLPTREQEHLLFAVFDLARPLEPPVTETRAEGSSWELNVGIGAGLTRATPQHAIVKAIVGRSF